MKIEDIEVEVVMNENTSVIVTEAILNLYENNVSQILDIPNLNLRNEKLE